MREGVVQTLFVFGTMRDREVLEAVLGRGVRGAWIRPAVLRGYSAVTVPEETYPVLTDAPGAEVPGELVGGLDARDMARVSFFEEDEYRLSPCRVVVEGEGEVWALFCADVVNDPEARVPWEFEWWRQQHKPAYLEIVRKYMAVFGRGTREQADALWWELETARKKRSSAA